MQKIFDSRAECYLPQGSPEKETFSRWYSETPSGFTLSLKGSRFVTHVKKLKSPIEPLDVFFSRAKALKEKLGVILWQFPPDFKADAEKLRKFIEVLSQYKAKNTFEFRDKSWINKKIISLLGRIISACAWLTSLNSCATCRLPLILYTSEGTALTENMSPAITRDQLKIDAKLVNKFMKQGKDVFMYFNNDALGNAPKNAMELRKILKK